tara:strand:+ start:337 stop:876 length:540 start_codon:yes stop_codon:yes gene_type:complete
VGGIKGKLIDIIITLEIMKKLLLMSLLVLFGCSEKEEEIEEEIIYPDITLQIMKQTPYGSIRGQFDFKELCCGSRSAQHCLNPLLVGCYRNSGEVNFVDNITGDLVTEVIAKCNSTIKIKINPGVGWRFQYIRADGDFFGEIEQSLDTEITLNNSTTYCFTKERITVNVGLYIDPNQNR